MNKFSFFLMIFLLILSARLGAEESILNFFERMMLHRDRSADLFIEIKVEAENIQIKHGIYIEFYEKWKDEFGKERSCRFFVKSVSMDGHVEEFHIERLNRGFRIYIGSPHRYVSRGVHTYLIHIVARRVVKSYGDFDEIYWNVIAPSWKLPIESAEAEIILPVEGFKKIISYRGYSGGTGSKEWKGKIELIEKERKLRFLLKKIVPGEGFTIAVSFKKGFFEKEDIFFWIKELWITRTDLFIGSFLVFLFYFVLWLIAGKDPGKGVIIPLYYPPEGVSPGAARYIMKMGYDNKVLISNIIDLAVKGYLKIREEDGDIYLEKTNKPYKDDLTIDEKFLMKHLFLGKTSVSLTRSESKFLQDVVRKFKGKLASSFEGRFFRTNIHLFGIGILVSFGVLIKSALSYPMTPFIIFLVVWISIWSMGIYKLFLNFKVTFRAFFESREKKFLFLSIVQFLFLMVFTAGEIMGFFFLKLVSDSAFLIFFLFLFVTNFTFYQLLKVPTRFGRKLMDRIEGFKLYLKVAERDRLEALIKKYGVEKLFERYLPYSIALDVEKKWGEKFESILIEYGKSGYSPSWYNGRVYGVSTFPAAISSSVRNSISTATSSGTSAAAGGGGGGGGW